MGRGGRNVGSPKQKQEKYALERLETSPLQTRRDHPIDRMELCTQTRKSDATSKSKSDT